MDAQRALLVARRWWLVIIVGTLIAAGAAYAYSKTLPKVYEATAMLKVTTGVPTGSGGDDFNELQATWGIAADDQRLIATLPVAQDAIKRASAQLSRALDATTLLKDLRVQVPPQSALLSVAVLTSNPRDASLLANAVVDSFIARDSSDRTVGATNSLAAIEATIRSYNRDLADVTLRSQHLAQQARLTPSQQAQYQSLLQRGVVDQGLLDRWQSFADGLRLRLAGAGTTLSLAQHAPQPTEPISPRTTTNTLIAAVLALVILTGMVLLLDLLDRRPRSPEELAQRLDLPLLGRVDTPLTGAAPATLSDTASAIADAMRVVRANVGARRALLVSTTGGEEASTVAAHLAAAYARAGSRVLLVDANVRTPYLAAALGQAERGGLAAVLRGGDALADVRESGVSNLQVLTGGADGPETLDLLGSARMREGITAWLAAYDIVVMNGPYLGEPEVLWLAPAADTLLVLPLHGADTDDVCARVERIRQAGATVVGVIVTAGRTARGTRAAWVRRESAAPNAIGREGVAERRSAQ